MEDLTQHLHLDFHNTTGYIIITQTKFLFYMIVLSNMTGATSRAGTIYPSGAPTFASGYFVGFTHFLVFRSVLSTIVCLSFFFFLCLLLFTASPLLSFYFPDFY